MTEDQRKPKNSVVAVKDKRLKKGQKVNHNTHCGARELPVLSPGEYVVMDREESGELVEETATRSGEFSRNWWQLTL